MQKIDNNIPCICCNSLDRRLISNVGRGFAKLTTVICTGCGLIHSLPIPTEIELVKFYKENYRISYKSTYKPKLKHTLRYASGLISNFINMISVVKNIKDKKFLDIGSGSGEMLYFAKKSGFDVLGIEPNSGYADFSSKELSLPIFKGTYEEASLKKNHYDVINLSEVLEHMRDPTKVLKDLYSYLKNDGFLFINVPNIEIGIHAPNTRFHYAHIYNFNHLSLKKIIDMCGFQILNPETLNTHIIAQKKSFPINNIAYDFNENYRRINNRLCNTNYLNHYLTFQPYWRLVKKCIQAPKEVIMSIILNDHKVILERIYKKQKPDLIYRFLAKIDNIKKV